MVSIYVRKLPSIRRAFYEAIEASLLHGALAAMRARHRFHVRRHCVLLFRVRQWFWGSAARDSARCHGCISSCCAFGGWSQLHVPASTSSRCARWRCG
jgi:hypothetical protein